MPAIVISMSNLKGGVGKSSTTLHLAGTLAKEGSRVAVIDADPQASLTQGFFGPDETRALPRHRTIAAYFADGLTPAASEVVYKVNEHAGIFLLAGSRHLASFNVPDPHTPRWTSSAPWSRLSRTSARKWTSSSSTPRRP